MSQTFLVSDVLLTSPSGLVPAPLWMKSLPHSTKTAGQFLNLKNLPTMTVVQAAGPADVLAEPAFLDRLVALHDKQDPAKILFCFSDPELKDFHRGTLVLTNLLARFRKIGDVECTRQNGAFAIQGAMAKLAIEATHPRVRPLKVTDPLSEVKRVVKATAGLRGASGRLEAGRVAQALNLKVAELASLMGRSRQTVSKTPDAESLQEPLHEFEKIARLLSVLSPKDFRAWLNLQNAQLENRSPLQAIRAGRVGPVADLAEDMLSGAPA